MDVNAPGRNFFESVSVTYIKLNKIKYFFSYGCKFIWEKFFQAMMESIQNEMNFFFLL